MQRSEYLEYHRGFAKWDVEVVAVPVTVHFEKWRVSNKTSGIS